MWSRRSDPVHATDTPCSPLKTSPDEWGLLSRAKNHNHLFLARLQERGARPGAAGEGKQQFLRGFRTVLEAPSTSGRSLPLTSLQPFSAVGLGTLNRILDVPWWPSGDGRWPNVSWPASFARPPRRRGEKLHFFPVILELSALHIWEILLSNSLSDGLWSQLISSSSPSV